MTAYTKFELRQIMDDYDYVQYSPEAQGMHFGCDCGCGGGDYTEEEWDFAEASAKEAEKIYEKMCKDLGVTDE